MSLFSYFFIELRNSQVAEHIISVIGEFSNKKPPQPLLISFNPEEVRNQAAASTKRFEEGIKRRIMAFTDCVDYGRVFQWSTMMFVCFGCVGNQLSILDGIFVAIKDDIDCFPHPSKGK